MITDETYRFLSNRSYWLDPEHDNYRDRPKVNQQFNYGSSQFQILKKENDASGMQAMAVAPIKNGHVDTSQVVIAYAGTNSGDWKDSETDLRTVGGAYESAIKMSQTPALHFLGGESQHALRYYGQIQSATDFASEIKSEYPNAEMTTTGHSLGEYTALYIAAENQWSNVGFNGPDPYQLLSPKAKKWVKENPGMLMNYRNRGDKLIGNLMGNGTGAQVLISMEMGLHLNPLDYHSLSNWRFDSKGRLIIPENDFNGESILQQKQNKIMQQFSFKLEELKLLKHRLARSKGGLSSGEKNYLDDNGALAVVEMAKAEFALDTKKLIKIYRDGIEHAQTLWDETLSSARNSGYLLSDYEIISELESSGFTKRNIVTRPTDEYDEKMNQIQQMSVKFDQLIESIKDKIHELVARDQELAVQLKNMS